MPDTIKPPSVSVDKSNVRISQTAKELEPELDSFIKHVISVSKDIVVNDAGHVPVFIMNTPQGVVVLLIADLDEQTKTFASRIFCMLTSKSKATDACFVAESFMSNDKDVLALKIMPSQAPDRQECLLFIRQKRSGETETYNIPFVRNEGKIEFAEMTVFRGPSIRSRFLPFY